MTELRKKAIDTCYRALEVLNDAHEVLVTQRLNTPFELSADLDEYIRKIGSTGATADVVLVWAENDLAQEGLIQMGLDILISEMKELGFDMEGTKK